MKKFISLLLLCLVGMAAWAADLENVALKTDAGSYLAGTSSAINVSTTAQNFTLKAVAGEAGAYQLLNTDLACWVNSGSNGYLSYAPQSQTNNARYFYFYKVLSSSATSVTANLATTPTAGEKYVIVVKNTNTSYAGYYAICGQLASGKSDRLDVVNKLSDTAPSLLSLSTSNESSNGPIDIAKVVWTVEQLAAPEPPVDVTKTYYLYDKGISQYVVIPSATGSSATITPSTTDKTAVKFAAVTGGYSIQDATTGNYIGIDSWNAVSTTTAQPWAIAKVEGGITIKNTSGTYAGSYFGGQDGKTKFYNNNPDAIVFSLEEVAPATKECPQCSEAVDIDATECPKCGYVFEAEPTIEFLATFDFNSSSVTAGATSVNLNGTNGVSVTVATSNTSGLGSGTSTYSLTDDQITSLNTNVNSTSAFTNSAAQTYITAGAKAATADLTITISGLTANKPYNISLVTGLDFEGSGSWNKITSSNTCDSSNPALGSESIQVRALNPYVITSMVADGEGKITLVVDDNNGSHTAVINALAIAKVPTVSQTYTVSITGNADGKLIYNGNEYGNNATFDADVLSATMLSAKAIAGYTSSVSLSGTTITVTYTAISYTFETSSLPVAGEWQNGTKFYTIKEMRAGYLCANQLPNIKNQTTAPATDDGKWAVIANGSYFQFMNKATQEVLTFAGTANDALASTTENLDDPYSLIDVVTYLNPSFESGYECFKIAGAEAYPNDKGIGLAVWNSNQALWGWGYSATNPGGGDDGSKFLFSLVETLEDVTYTVSVVGAPAGETVTVTVKGETVVNNSVTLSSTASAADVVATTISGYSYNVTIDANANTITVTYEEATPAEGTVYTIKALFPAQYTPVYLSYEGGSLTFPTSVNGVKSYWVARASGEERPWKFQSGYGDGSYLDGNSSTAISTTGAAYNVSETTYGFHMQTYVDGISYPGLKYIGTWDATTHAVGHGKYGGAYGGSDSYAQWTTHYAIEPVPDVVVYSVVCANTQGGVTPTFANYAGVNVVRDGGIVIADKSIELSSANLTAAAITGYAGTVSVSGRVITVTYEQTSEPIDVTYSFTVDGVTIGSRTITELRGEAPTVASILPSYVQASGIPATVEQNAYTIATTYTGLPFEVDTKQYYINEWAQNTRNYLLYSNGTNVKEIKQDCNTADFDVNVRATGTETESYLWTVGGDWLNGFTFMSADGYYMQSPSKNPSNSDQAKVTKTLDSNCYFEPFVQASSGKFSWRPMGGSNNFAHTSDGNLVMGFYNGYTGASLEATTFTFIEYKATQTCPQCGEIVDADATVCPKCGYDLTPGIEITIGTAGYATIAYAEDFVKPEGVKAYYCIYEGEEGHLTPVEWEKSYLPGYCAYILEGTPGTYSFKVTNDYEEEGYPAEDYEALEGLFYENLLYGNFDDTDYDVEDAKADIYCDNIYVFSVAGTPAKPGFYRYVGTTLAAHKAYYATATALVNGFIVDFEGTEGINAVMSATNLKAGYDIQGRRINKVQKGINILSGKKIIK